MATKKTGGSSKNGRDSKGQRLGIKTYGSQRVIPGQIIVRQRGTRFYSGVNTKIGKDHTIYSTINGIVVFEKIKHNRKVINVKDLQEV